MAKRIRYSCQKLSNEKFVANAKPVVQKRNKQTDYQAKYDATVARKADWYGEIG